MFEYLILSVVAIVVLGVLVIVHEAGHFLVAKLCRVGVLEFSIGFGRKLWRRRYRETNYAVRLIPLGGYVRMFGDDPFETEAQARKDEPSGDGLRPEGWGAALDETDFLNMQDESRWFLRKGFWAKAAIVLAGPLANLVFAFLLSVASFMAGGKPDMSAEPNWAPVVGGVIDGLPAARAGLKPGDRVLSIDGRELSTWRDVSDTIRESGGREMLMVITRLNRDSEAEERLELRLAAVPDSDEMKLLEDQPAAKQEGPVYKIGMVPEIPRVPASFAESVGYGAMHVWFLCRMTLRVLTALVVGEVAPSKVVGGPLAMLKGAATSARAGPDALADFMIFLSVGLAIFNLLPIPILDGGHLLFFLIEALKGSPLSLRWRAAANHVGIVLLAFLLLYAMKNDIVRLFLQ